MKKKIIAILFTLIFLVCSLGFSSAESTSEIELNEEKQLKGTFEVLVYRFGLLQNYYTKAKVTFQHQTRDEIYYEMDSVNSDYYFIQDVIPGEYKITAEKDELKGSTIKSVASGETKEVDLRIGLIHSKTTNIILLKLFDRLKVFYI